MTPNWVKSIDCDQNIKSSAGGQEPPACKISGLSTHGLSGQEWYKTSKKTACLNQYMALEMSDTIHPLIQATPTPKKGIMKWPRLTGDLLFLVRCRRRHRCRRSTNILQLFGKTPEANFFKPHMVNLWVWETCFVTMLVTLFQGNQATEAGLI